MIENPQWVVGVQTSPRLGLRLPEVIGSIKTAGWADLVVFGEPGTATSHTSVIWPYQFGDWAGWLSALSCLHATNPKADYFVMFEDDVVLCKNIREYLESFIHELPNFGTLNLYTPERHHSTFGHKPCITDESSFGWEMWGAQGVVFTKNSLREFLGSSFVLGFRDTEIGQANAHKDSAIGIWGRETGKAIYYHTPSMVEHVALSSTIGNTPHTAFEFVGENFDAKTWIGKGPIFAFAKIS